MGGGRAYRRWLSGFVAAAALLAVTPAAHAVDVPVRAATHKSFGRVVFDWPLPMGYSARIEGDRLVVAFEQPINAALDRAVAALPGYLSGVRIDGDGKIVEFDLKRPVSLKSFRNGNAIAIDLMPSAEAPQTQGQSQNQSQGRTEARGSAAAAAKEPSGSSGPTPVENGAGKAPVAGKVAVRAGDHPTHSRVVFDWPTAVDYTMKRDGAAITLQFDHGATADLTSVARAKLRNIQNMEQFRQPNGALAVTFATPHDAEVKDTRNGRSVIVDVLNAGTRKAPEAQAANPETAPESPPEPPPSQAAPQPLPPPGSTTTTVRPLPASAAPAAPAPAAPAAVPPPPKEGPSTAIASSAAMAAGANAAAVGGKPAATAKPEPVKPEPAKPEVTKPELSKPEPPKPAAATGPSLVFDAGGPASVAVYPRAGHLYIVFDKPLPIGTGRLEGSGTELLGGIEPVPATGGTAFRTRTGPMVWPMVERQGTVWRITPTSRLTATPPSDLRIDPDPDFLLGARLVVRAPDAASVVQISDPDVGDRLHVVPLPSPGNAVVDAHRYADLEVIPSYQGVVVRPIADSVSVRPVKEGVELTAAGGLHLSPIVDAASQPGSPPSAGQPRPGGASATQTALMPPEPKAPPQGKRLFELAAWQHGGLDHFTEARQDLQNAVVNAPDSERPKAHLDLARFYFAHGLGQEANGLLEVLLQKQPDLEGWPEFRALRGGIRVLTGDLDGATADLNHPDLANNTEAGLWRAAIAAEKADWPRAHAGFKTAGGILMSYPDPLLSRFALKAGEAALEARDVNFAKRVLDRVIERGGPDAEERADLQYLRGLYYAQNGDTERALEQLRASYNGLDRFYQAKAGLALVNLELAEGRTSPPAAAERLAGLTFTWRGDDLEMKIRQRMGEVLIAAGNYVDGFNAMKETAALVADTPRAEAITRDMGRIFGDLFKDGAARLPTLEALQLYDQFRELTPVGEEGDEIIRQLAERLIALDLLGRAADLLQHQVEYRLKGPDKARIGTRLASVRLLDNKPEQAIQALELSNIPNIPPDLMAERRLMQAKALAEMGRGDEALHMLSQDDSKPANLLRVDIAWRAQKWDAAALALNKVIGPPPAAGQPFDPATAQLVLNRAVALALSGDATGLNLLRKDFGTAMAAGPEADAFRLLTRPEQALGLVDANTIRSRVAEVDVFQKFLKGYRGKQNAAPPAAPAMN